MGQTFTVLKHPAQRNRSLGVRLYWQSGAWVSVSIFDVERFRSYANRDSGDLSDSQHDLNLWCNSNGIAPKTLQTITFTAKATSGARPSNSGAV